MDLIDTNVIPGPEDYKHIEAVLEKYGEQGSFVSTSQLEGFLTGVISGPRMIMPSEWMSHIWGGEGSGPVWDSAEEFQRFYSHVMRMNNEIADTLANYPEDFEALCLVQKKKGKKVKNYSFWCLGYITAINIDLELWEDALSEIEYAFWPLFGLANTLAKEPSIELTEENKTFMNTVVENCALEIYDFWKERRQPFEGLPLEGFETSESGAQPFRKDGQKTGVNEECPCGSGRKYKKCCMNKKKAAPSFKPPSMLFDTDSIFKPLRNSVPSGLDVETDPDSDPEEWDDEEIDLEFSPLGQVIERDGKKVEMFIYLDSDETWILEFEDEGGGSAIFDGFETDQIACDFAMETIEKEGIDYVIVEKEAVAKLHSEEE